MKIIKFEKPNDVSIEELDNHLNRRITMNDTEKLDRILKILDKQQQENYIPSKWKPLIDYLEREEIEPLLVLELMMLMVQINKDRARRIAEKENEPI